MSRHHKRLVSALALLICTAGVQAHAKTPAVEKPAAKETALPASVSPLAAPPRAEYGKVYLGLSAGAFVPQDIHVSASGSINGTTVTGSGDISTNAGAAISGVAGYTINDYFAVEGELGYASSDLDRVSGTVTAGALAVTGSLGLSGKIDTVLGFANAIVTPRGIGAKFSPYFGGGLGFSNTTFALDKVTDGIDTLNVNTSKTRTDLAADGILGLNYTATENLSVGGRYKFVWVGASDLYKSDGVKNDDLTAHMLTVAATYRF